MTFLRQHSEAIAWGIVILLVTLTVLQAAWKSWSARRSKDKEKSNSNWPPISRAGLLLFVLPLIGCEDHGEPACMQSIYELPAKMAMVSADMPNWFLWGLIVLHVLTIGFVGALAMQTAYQWGWGRGREYVMRKFTMRTAEFDVQDHAPAKFEDHTGIKPKSCAADSAS